ncbi:UNVERIFIED_CONTAM: hypothetical protein GTU68_053327 [Idotea baltica]|nr:hypothetical protein [Idotea baltica]
MYTRLMSGIKMEAVCEPFIRRRAVRHLEKGKAMPSMLDSIRVEYYGSMAPLNQVASVTSPDPRTLFVKPFEKTLIAEIEKSIRNSDLGLNPQNDGQQIIISIPQLTEERRIGLAKQAKTVTENAKISVRNARKETNDELKQLQKDGAAEDVIKRAEDDVQKLTDAYSKKMDALLSHKESEIMTV